MNGDGVESCVFEAGEGRIFLKAEVFYLGKDLLVIVKGGASHIGATALAVPGEAVKVCAVCGHRDGEIAEALAEYLCGRLNAVVAVCAGIHYNEITHEEIETVRKLCRKMAEKIKRAALCQSPPA